MHNEDTAVLKQEGNWWVDWIEEVPGVNCQERTEIELPSSIRQVLTEALELNRQEARSAAGKGFLEEPLAL